MVKKSSLSTEMASFLEVIKKDILSSAPKQDTINKMKQLREMFKEVNMPTIVKSVRLAYEHFENNDSLNNLTYWEEEEIELEDNNAGLIYLLDLFFNPENKYNLEEIKLINESLKGD